MIHKIVCSRCNKIVGSYVDEDVTIQIFPFALEKHLYNGPDLSSLQVAKNFNSDIFCSDCANKPKGGEA